MGFISGLMQKSTWMFVAAAYVSYIAGGWIIDYIAPMLGSIFTVSLFGVTTLGDVIKFAFPTLILYFWYVKKGR